MIRSDFLSGFIVATTIITVGIFTECFISSCSKPPTPVKKKGANTVVVCVGGLGSDQTRELYDKLTLECPNALILSAGSWDGYKADIVPMIEAEKKDSIVLIGHSFGASTVVDACARLPYVNKIFLIDPVKPGWGDMEMPSNIGGYEIFWRTDTTGPRIARFPGTTVKRIVGGHNDVPHNWYVIDDCKLWVNIISGANNNG